MPGRRMGLLGDVWLHVWVPYWGEQEAGVVVGRARLYVLGGRGAGW